MERMTERRPPNGISSRILTCLPETALQHVPFAYMRQWYYWQPDVLQRYGCLPRTSCLLPKPAEQVYFGGLTQEKDRFVLVPEDLFEQRRFALLLQFARHTLPDASLYVRLAYCAQAERVLADEDEVILSSSLFDALEADRQARSVMYWFRLSRRS